MWRQFFCQLDTSLWKSNQSFQMPIDPMSVDQLIVDPIWTTVDLMLGITSYKSLHRFCVLRTCVQYSWWLDDSDHCWIWWLMTLMVDGWCLWWLMTDGCWLWWLMSDGWWLWWLMSDGWWLWWLMTLMVDVSDGCWLWRLLSLMVDDWWLMTLMVDDWLLMTLMVDDWLLMTDC